MRVNKVVALVALCGLAAGCGGGSDASRTTTSVSGSAGSSGSAAGTPKDVKVQYGWMLNGGSAPSCLALVKGYYEAEGLNVTLVPGGPIGTTFLDATNAVSSDESITLGVDNVATSLIVGKSKDPNFPVKIFADLWQEAPIGFIVRHDSGLKSIKDLAGKRPDGSKWRIGATPNVPLLIPIAQYMGVDVKDLDVTTIAGDITPLTAGQIDALFGFETTQAVAARMTGVEYDFLPLSEIPGLSQPGYVAMARESELTDDKDTLVRWLRATLKGNQDMLADPEAAAQAVTDKRCGGPQMKVPQEKALIEASRKYIEVDGGLDKVGHIDTATLDAFAAKFIPAAGLKSVPKAEDYVDMSVLKELGIP